MDFPMEVFKKLFVLLLFLKMFSVPIYSSTFGYSQDPVCGHLTQKNGQVIQLREDETLPDTLFENIHMEGAILSPRNDCVIMVCGFLSLQNPYSPDYIGSPSDYADCELFEETSGDPETYTSKFNVSMISCACNKHSGDCQFNCHERRENHQWEEDECAVLYQEHSCYQCWFRSFSLKTTTDYKTDNSHLINSIVVRKGCLVTQNSTSIKKLWRYRDSSGIFQYYDEPNLDVEYPVTASFLNGSDTFRCECGVTPPTPPSEWGLTVTVISAGVAFILFGLVVLVLWIRTKKRHLSSRSNEGGGFSNPAMSTSTTALPQEIFKTPLGDVEAHEHLGSGGFGQVRVGTLKKEKKCQVAIKTVKVAPGHGNFQDELKSLEREIDILKRLGTHKNVVLFKGAVIIKDQLWMLMEYCQHKSLKIYLDSIVRPQLNRIRIQKFGDPTKSKNRGSYKVIGFATDVVASGYNDLQSLDPSTLIQFLCWAEEIACGLDYITKKGVHHLDVAARNILLDHNLIAKVGDFGLARKGYDKDYTRTLVACPPQPWVAPEVYQKTYVPETDVWSFGTVLFEIFSGGQSPTEDTIIGIGNTSSMPSEPDRLLPNPEFAPDYICTKIAQCRQWDPKSRPPFCELEKYFETKKDEIRLLILGESEAQADSQAI